MSDLAMETGVEDEDDLRIGNEDKFDIKTGVEDKFVGRDWRRRLDCQCQSEGFHCTLLLRESGSRDSIKHNQRSKSANNKEDIESHSKKHHSVKTIKPSLDPADTMAAVAAED